MFLIGCNNQIIENLTSKEIIHKRSMLGAFLKTSPKNVMKQKQKSTIIFLVLEMASIYVYTMVIRYGVDRVEEWGRGMQVGTWRIWGLLGSRNDNLVVVRGPKELRSMTLGPSMWWMHKIRM